MFAILQGFTGHVKIRPEHLVYTSITAFTTLHYDYLCPHLPLLRDGKRTESQELYLIHPSVL